MLTDKQKTKERDYQNNWKKNQRLKIITHYSKGTMSCVRCGISDIRVLSIDHINGGGHAQIRNTHTSLPQWIINNKYPEGLQILCQNCQFIKATENKEWSSNKGVKLIDNTRRTKNQK